jgi:hypothetical protein
MHGVSSLEFVPIKSPATHNVKIKFHCSISLIFPLLLSLYYHSAIGHCAVNIASSQDGWKILPMPSRRGIADLKKPLR